MAGESKSNQQLLLEIEELKSRLSEAEDTLEAIRTGAVDALVISDEQGEKIFSLQSIDYSYRILVENMNEGAVILDKDGVIVFTNQAFSNMAGRGMMALVGAQFADFLPDSFQDRFFSFLSECVTRPHQAEFSITCPKGAVMPVAISGSIFEIDNNQNICLILRDLKERKDADQKLHDAYEAVEEKVLERTAELRCSEESLRKSNALLEDRNAELDAFNYSVSHDLRGPLTVISGFAQMLRKDYGATIGDMGKLYIDHILDSSNRMVQTIKDMLSLSQISRAEIDLTQVDLSAIARDIALELKLNSPSRKVELIIAESIIVHADSGLMRIVMENLVRNAWKFTANLPQARIEVSCRQNDGRTICYVRDNGAGFDMKHSDKLFRPFQRLHTDKEFAGTGLGLAIISRIIGLHGGKVWAEGEPGKGATIYFELPEKVDIKASGGARDTW